MSKINEKIESEYAGVTVEIVGVFNGWLLKRNNRTEAFLNFSDLVNALYQDFGMHQDFRDKVVLSLEAGDATE